MSLLSQLNTILDSLNVPVETGIFSGIPPDEYVVITPMTDEFVLFADNRPLIDVSEARLSLFCKSNYIRRKKQITQALLAADLTITERRYIGYETDAGYHNYAIDVKSQIRMED